MNVKLKRLLLPLLRAAAKGTPPSFRMRSAASQALFLIGKPSSKAKAGRLRRNSEKQSARASHQQETAKIWNALNERAGGACECGCGIWFSMRPGCPAELDHYYGRGVVPQSVENCWFLISAHHKSKTENRPSRAAWDALFAAHCAKYGYEFKPRLIHAEPAKAGGAP